MLATEAPELPLAYPQTIGQGVNTALVQSSELDQRECPGHRARCAPPGPRVRNRLRPTPKAGAKPRLLGGGRRGIEGHVLRPRRPGWTDRTAVDACRLHGGEEPPVEASIAQLECAVARVVIEIHAEILAGRNVAV
jgi:hypothetical protein